MSVGSILLATLFIIVFGYLSIGMSLKYFIIGARGSEVIPNINFWRNLPSLVKVMFITSSFFYYKYFTN